MGSLHNMSLIGTLSDFFVSCFEHLAFTLDICFYGKDAKKVYVEEMKKNFTSNESVMIAQYQGLNVTELDELRKELRNKGILFKITKNRITKIAIKETPVKDLEKYFTGPTAAAISSDPISTAKILTKFSNIFNFD